MNPVRTCVAAVVSAVLLFLTSVENVRSGSDWEAGASLRTDWEEVTRDAVAGNPEAQIRLGNAYLDNEAVFGGTGELPRDDVQAYLWLSLGVAGLSDARTDTLMIKRDFAIESLARLERRLTPLQLREAQRLIREPLAIFRQSGV